MSGFTELSNTDGAGSQLERNQFGEDLVLHSDSLTDGGHLARFVTVMQPLSWFRRTQTTGCLQTGRFEVVLVATCGNATWWLSLLATMG